MSRHPVVRTVVQVVVAAGIFMSMLMAGAAPSDFVTRRTGETTTQP